MMDIQLMAAVSVVKNAYETDEKFRNGVKASALSVLRELKGSYSDEVIAQLIADRIFGKEDNN